MRSTLLLTFVLLCFFLLGVLSAPKKSDFEFEFDGEEFGDDTEYPEDEEWADQDDVDILDPYSSYEDDQEASGDDEGESNDGEQYEGDEASNEYEGDEYDQAGGPVEITRGDDQEESESESESDDDDNFQVDGFDAELPDFSGDDEDVRSRFGIPSDAEMAEMKRKQDAEKRKEALRKKKASGSANETAGSGSSQAKVAGNSGSASK